MKKSHLFSLLGISLLCLNAQEKDPIRKASLTVDLDKEIAQVSPSMYGVFFEDINLAADGGIYAELVRNRSFEDMRPPEGTVLKEGKFISPGGFSEGYTLTDSIPAWKLLQAPGAKGTMRLETKKLLNKAQQYALRLSVQSNAKGRVAAVNQGYFGIAVRKGEAYDLSIYAKAAGKLGEALRVTLEDSTGKVYGQASIQALSAEWSKYTATITPSQTATNLRLAFSLTKPATIWLDMVSLFPRNTYAQRKNGMRTDVMQKLDSIHPAFLRFPGGCVVEGFTFENAVQWKTTIGNVAQRPGHYNLWGYRASDGLGFHEFLQMCEDLKMAPLFVFNAGLTCQFRNPTIMPLNQLDPLVQDALDALEYANGPASSKWGAQRVKNGHPKPFNIQYVQIGNENWGPDYLKRYTIFYDAITSRYPTIKTILCTEPWPDRPIMSFPDNKGDFIDFHFYRDPSWFLKNSTLFDTYPRTGKHIYVGEYACNEKVGSGHLYSALSEAAFLTGLEHNADLVQMTSYAPLLENVQKEGFVWPVNLIRYNNHSSFGIPSYYVQQLFSNHKGNTVVASSIQSDSVSVEYKTKLESGGIGFETYSTESEFDDILVVSGKDTLMKEDFSNPNKPFALKKEGGDWKIQQGVLQQSNKNIFAHATIGDPSWKNYTLTLKARKMQGSEGFLVRVLGKDDKNYVWWNIGGWSNTQHILEISVDGQRKTLGNLVKDSVVTGKWYNVKMVVKDNRVMCYLDGKLLHNVDVPMRDTFPGLYSVVSKDTKTNEVIVKLVNPFGHTYQTHVSLKGKMSVGSEGKEIILSSANPEDKNSFEEPYKVAPVSRKVSGLGKEFDYILKPYSLTILRLPLKQAQ